MMKADVSVLELHSGDGWTTLGKPLNCILENGGHYGM